MRLTLYFLTFLPFITWAQSGQLVLKDGTVAGDRADLHKACMKGLADQKNVAFMDARKACDCVLDILVEVDLDTAEMDAETFFAEVMAEDTLLNEAFSACIAASIRTDVPISKFGLEFTQALISECSNGMAASLELSDAGVDPDGTCRCVFEEARRKGLTMEDIAAMQDQSSVHFNEIMIPCVQKNIRTADRGRGKQLGSPDVSGRTNTQRIGMMHVGNVFKVKVRLGGIERYFILDSGASDCMIPASLEKELLANQAIRPDQYLEQLDYRLADGRIVSCKRVHMNGVGLGDFTVRDVVVAVIDEEVQPLLGKSLLDKFEEWTVDPQDATLYVKRK